MNKLLATTLTAALLSAGGFSAANVLHTDKVEAAQTQKVTGASQYGSNYQLQIAADTLTQLPEYATVASKVDVSGLQAKITEDSNYKRVILFKEANGQGKYKSIFVKNTNTLEVIDLKAGQVFYGTITTDDTTPAPEAKPEQPVQSAISSLPEYATLTSKVDVASYKAAVVEDNFNKRVIVLKDDNGREQFKSIFVKETNTLKIIDTKGGQIFYGVITAESTPSAAQPVEQQAAPAVSVQQVKQQAAPAASGISALPEYNKLASVVDVASYTAQIAEDNYSTRTILLKDAKGSVQYKSIFVKRTNMLKVINTRGGMVFYGSL
ncbi:hypothetical protein NCCP2222_12660 [Sporosarcina sp. NCCP-2222]|uniref:hypothetical protein n=1 Tax=Sporosarcina sp. NCCP-2222 TaxID=2935073 RepID=UPI002083C255|nr:hypothetical protein [Sporosarcina sp. NCCP-2222]GKV55319.1 hypothetical protein NCCP2222_12660 [Sporosarcina sp. NCCP-2222]